jgi:hypothetical protein
VEETLSFFSKSKKSAFLEGVQGAKNSGRSAAAEVRLQLWRHLFREIFEGIASAYVSIGLAALTFFLLVVPPLLDCASAFSTFTSVHSLDANGSKSLDRLFIGYICIGGHHAHPQGALGAVERL